MRDGPAIGINYIGVDPETVAAVRAAVGEAVGEMAVAITMHDVSGETPEVNPEKVAWIVEPTSGRDIPVVSRQSMRRYKLEHEGTSVALVMGVNTLFREASLTPWLAKYFVFDTPSTDSEGNIRPGRPLGIVAGRLRELVHNHADGLRVLSRFGEGCLQEFQAFSQDIVLPEA